MINHSKLLKLRRRLLKKYIKLTQPKKNWHLASYWPYLKEKNNNIYFRDELINIKNLSSINLSNEDVNIIGSGPSVNDLDYTKIKNGHNFFLNGAISLSYNHNLPIYAHVIMDSYFVYNRIDLIIKNTQPCKLILSRGALCAIAEHDINFIKRNEIYIFDTKPLSNESLFSEQVDDYVIDGGTVMSIPIQLCLKNAPKAVYLLGLDISNSKLPRFYEDVKNQQKSGLIKDYYKKILPFMTEASKRYKEKKLPIYNCSPVSQLPYDIIPHSDIYEK